MRIHYSEDEWSIWKSLAKIRAFLGTKLAWLKTPLDGGDIFYAAKEGRVKRAQALLERDPSLAQASDVFGRTALHIAAHEGYTDIMKLLLANGANVDALSTDEDTPLMWSVVGGHLEAVELLLAHDANVDAEDKDGWTPLRFAIEQNHRVISESLRRHGAA